MKTTVKLNLDPKLAGVVGLVAKKTLRTPEQITLAALKYYFSASMDVEQFFFDGEILKYEVNKSGEIIERDLQGRALRSMEIHVGGYVKQLGGNAKALQRAADRLEAEVRAQAAA